MSLTVSPCCFPDENLVQEESKSFFSLISPVILVHSAPDAHPETSQGSHSHLGICHVSLML